MSLNFGQIPPLTMELAALERLKNLMTLLDGSQVSDRCLLGYLLKNPS